MFTVVLRICLVAKFARLAATGAPLIPSFYFNLYSLSTRAHPSKFYSLRIFICFPSLPTHRSDELVLWRWISVRRRFERGVDCWEQAAKEEDRPGRRWEQWCCTGLVFRSGIDRLLLNNFVEKTKITWGTMQGGGTSTPMVRHRRRSNEALPHTPKENGGELLLDDRNKYKSMWIRTYSTVWMIGGFVFLVYMGHLYIWAMVIAIQILMAKELFNLMRKTHEDRQLPGFRILNWHFFFTAMLFVYGRILSQRLVNTVTADKILLKLVSNLVKYQMAICYFLYITGFVWFILTLKKKMYKYQFGQFAWTHMILIVVFTQSSFTVANIFEGIFWFLLPASLIVINDIAAYLCGFFFGRTPLIKLSPKKTWEGFLGASVVTMISAFMLANVMGRFQWFTCPRKDLSTGWLYCDPGPLFKPELYSLQGWVPVWFPWKEMAISPAQWHALCLGLFASIIAPFGGFFASGFKRAFKIKDFGDSIPGHGGMTDRMDCQMVMAVFAYIYHQTFVITHGLSVESILDQILVNLPFEEQLDLYRRLGNILHDGQLGG